MISLIIGKKGSGKTKNLIDHVNQAAETSNGNVVCIEKGDVLRFDVSSKARLVNVEDYNIANADAYIGFLSGICAGNYDVTDIFCDATFKIIGKDFDLCARFIEKVSKLSQASNVNFLFTLSCDESDLPDKIFEFAGKI